MSDTSPADRLDWTGPGEARIAAGLLADEAALATCLMRVLSAAAGEAADGETVGLVSLTLDLTSAEYRDGPLAFASAIDRRTRTLVFANATARGAAGPVMTGTAVYRIGG